MYGQKGPEHTEAWGVKACTLAQVKDVAAQYGRLKKYQSKLIGSNSDDGLDHKGLFDLSDSATARTAGIEARLEAKIAKDAADKAETDAAAAENRSVDVERGAIASRRVSALDSGRRCGPLRRPAARGGQGSTLQQQGKPPRTEELPFGKEGGHTHSRRGSL